MSNKTVLSERKRHTARAAQPAWSRPGGGRSPSPQPEHGYPSLLEEGREGKGREGTPVLAEGWEGGVPCPGLGYPPPPPWTDTHLSKHYLPHSSDAGGKNSIFNWPKATKFSDLPTGTEVTWPPCRCHTVLNLHNPLFDTSVLDKELDKHITRLQGIFGLGNDISYVKEICSSRIYYTND